MIRMLDWWNKEFPAISSRHDFIIRIMSVTRGREVESLSSLSACWEVSPKLSPLINKLFCDPRPVFAGHLESVVTSTLQERNLVRTTHTNHCRRVFEIIVQDQEITASLSGCNELLMMSNVLANTATTKWPNTQKICPQTVFVKNYKQRWPSSFVRLSPSFFQTVFFPIHK